MSRHRFLQLLQCMHFTGNTKGVEDDKPRKTGPVLDKICLSFKTKFRPFQELCVDESLTKWRGCLSFKQLIPLKCHQDQVKLFVLCDCGS